MHKLYIFVIAALLGALTYMFFYYEPCKEPSELYVALAQLNCTLKITTEDLRAEACDSKGMDPGCVLTEEDKPLVLEIINSKVHACTVNKLKQDNYCTDKVK